MNPILMSALLDQLVFFNLCDEDECHPDVAVKQMESITSYLRDLSPEDQEAMKRHAAEMAQQEVLPPAQRKMLLDLSKDLLGEHSPDELEAAA